MGSWVNICPGCHGRFRDGEAFIWHTEQCDDYAALPVEGDETPTTHRMTAHLLASDIAADLARTIGTRDTANATVLVLQAAGRPDRNTDDAAQFTDAEAQRIRLSILTTSHPTIPEGTPTA